MELSKEQALKNLREAENTEFLLFASEVLTPMEHLRCCDVLQYMIRRAEGSTLQKFEGDE